MAMIIEKMIEAYTDRKAQAESYLGKVNCDSVITFDPRTLGEIPPKFDLIVFSSDPDQWNDKQRREDWIKETRKNIRCIRTNCDDQIQILKDHLTTICSVQVDNIHN